MSVLHNVQLNGPSRMLSPPNQESISDNVLKVAEKQMLATYANGQFDLRLPHVIKPSSIENCMPRAYIRVCLAFRVPQPESLPEALRNLRAFVRKLVDAKPYLAGYVVPARDPNGQAGRVEIQFTDEDFLTFNALQERRFTAQEMPLDYEGLDQAGLPPSRIRPELVSALPEGADEDRAPVFRVQANIVDGGLIISFYLHHCISDGTGLGLLISGSVVKDDFRFDRHLQSNSHPISSLTERLAQFATLKNSARSQWSCTSPNQIHTRHIHHKFFTAAMCVSNPIPDPGRGCIFAFKIKTLEETKALLRGLLNDVQQLTLEDTNSDLSTNDTLQALLWHHMSRARKPSLQDIYAITHSKLLIPVDIRSKLRPRLPPYYFGSAVDFASAKLPLHHLSKTDHESLACTAFTIRQAISEVNDPYIRTLIALANSIDSTLDVRDLLASNMNRVTGADLYITSWARLPLYAAELDLGLGQPDWVRKPWSKDPGSCIVLPRDERKDYLEVVVQMTEADMGRLLQDQKFMKYVERVIE